MLLVQDELDIQKTILPFLPRVAGAPPLCDVNLKLVGQERNGVFIYCWTEQVEVDQNAVTWFGIFNSTTKNKPERNKVVFVHNQKVDVVSCTVNEEHTFIGFVTREFVETTGQHGKLVKQDKYRAFLAETHQMGARLFSLDLERENYLQLQFMYGIQGTYPSLSAHLLVFLHRESIGLYHIPIQTSIDGIVEMGGEPNKEEVFKKRYVWSQWDAVSQCLHIVHFRKQGRNEIGRSVCKPFLTCYQFTNFTTAEFKLEVALELDIYHPKSRIRSSYFDLRPTSATPDLNVNLKVLSHVDGSMCVCYQHFSSNSKKGKEMSTKLSYSVLLLHHGCVLSAQSFMAPKPVTGNNRLHFCWLDNYLLVYLPGVFTHLLNVSLPLEPVHHLLFTNDGEDGTNQLALLQGPFTDLLLPPSATSSSPAAKGCVLYSSRTQKAYRLSLDHTKLVHFFAMTDLSLQLGILHYAVVHARQLQLIRSLFAVIASHPADPNVATLLQEFLTGATFTAMRQLVKAGLLRAFNFTQSETFRGQVQKDSACSGMYSLSYSGLGQVTFGEQHQMWSGVQHSHVTVAMWSLLRAARDSLLGVNVTTARFNSNVVAKAHDAEEDTSNSSENFAINRSVFHRLSAAAKSAFSVLTTTTDSLDVSLKNVLSGGQMTASVELLLGPSPPFLSKTSAQLTAVDNRKLQQTLECLTSHLVKYSEGHKLKESKAKLNSVAEDYVRCQMSQCHLLSHLIWSTLGDWEPLLHKPLYMTVSSMEYELFLLLERYQLALAHLCFPSPPGFQIFFTCLAFRSLDLRQFLRYVDLGLVQLPYEFATQLLEDLDDSAEKLHAKIEIICRLSKDDAVECLRHWQHPIAQRYRAQHYAAVCLSDESSVGWEIVSRSKTGQQSTVDTGSQSPSSAAVLPSFPPVTMFIKLLEKNDPGLSTGNSLGRLGMDSHSVEEVAYLSFSSSTSAMQHS